MMLTRSIVSSVFSDWMLKTGIAASISLNLSIGEVLNQWLTVIISALTIVYLSIRIRNAWRGSKADGHV